VSREIVEAVHVLELEKGISSERLMEALEDALLSAYKKTPGAAKYARVDMDRGSADFKVYELLVPDELEERLLAEVEPEEPAVDPETGEMTEPPEPELDADMLREYSDQIDERDVTPEGFGRIAAQTAKQVILQRIREAERDLMFEEYRDRVGELITGIVQQHDSRYTLVQLRERVEALLPKSEQIHQERYDHGQRIKAVITEVSAQAKGPSIIVSRRSPELIRKLFELEVPEIADGLVEITNVAREPGYRSKIAVVSHASGVDPVGACVGPRGSRVRMVVSELRGEKIDIIPFNEEPARFIAKALSPARVREVLVDDESKQATVVVPDDQLSLAIGREGLNARLAARLTGWRIDIRSETEFAEEESNMDLAEEAVAGRCAAILANGRRCPNAALPGSRYCGLPAHQALTDTDTDYVAGEPPEGGEVPDDEDLPEGESETPEGESETPEGESETPEGEAPAGGEVPDDEDLPEGESETPEGESETPEGESETPEGEAPAGGEVPDDEDLPEGESETPEAEAPADANVAATDEAEADAEAETPDAPEAEPEPAEEPDQPVAADGEAEAGR
jgi:N utilization substance protein A